MERGSIVFQESLTRTEEQELWTDDEANDRVQVRSPAEEVDGGARTELGRTAEEADAPLELAGLDGAEGHKMGLRPSCRRSSVGRAAVS